jgi:hypothetical protein
LIAPKAVSIPLLFAAFLSLHENINKLQSCLDPFERPDTSFLFANGKVFPFKNTDFLCSLQKPKLLPELASLPVQENGVEISAHNALRSLGMDTSLLNPQVWIQVLRKVTTHCLLIVLWNLFPKLLGRNEGVDKDFKEQK